MTSKQECSGTVDWRMTPQLTEPEPEHVGGSVSSGHVDGPRHLPLFRNASALFVSSAATSVLGLVYWILSARYYSPENVGRSSALVSIIRLLASIAQLNLAGALTRFLPRAGRATGRLVLSCYATAAGLGVAVSLLALPFIQGLSSAGWFVGRGPLFTLWYVAAVVAWCLFSLQDGALVGLRESIWVPFENAAFGAAKILLALALAALAPELGIFASWTIPMMLTVVPVSLLLFRRLIPRHSAVSRAEPIVPAQIRSFVAFDYLAMLLALASTDLLPILVATRAGVEANAYFYVAWIIAGALDFALLSVGMSLTAEGAHDPARLPMLVRALCQRIALLASPGILLLFIGTPYLLAIFGQAYALEATAVLRFFAVAMLARMVIVLWISVARVKQRMGSVLLVQAILSALLIGLSIPLIDRYGITGMGVAYLVSNCAVAAPLLPRLVRLMSLGKREAISAGFS